ncbi:MFS transporter [Sphingomonas glacialis]|uniref:MFS transporter n=1 Tax=Sphingomonas glacialis TaxID=658225 RepID=A0ABQ3LU81_9SPHN|nr:MFS transporter [Sphingomonas glacialis]GHH24878.1 MFS transporter [Sphingomonas glacialis]
MTDAGDVNTVTFPKMLSRRQIAAICAGNALEFYDFVVYAIFAVQIGRAFFPSDLPGVSLLASLATFGVGFATRPLGAFIIGRMADRSGRKPAMLVSFSLIGVSVGGLALTPGFAPIGMAAPVLAVLFRLLQGFALGGEVGPSTALLLESAPIQHRGLYVSLQAMSSDGAVMVAGLVGVILSLTLDAAAVDAWGWRLALLMGLVILPFALAARRTLVETLAMEEALPPHVVEAGTWRIVLCGLLMLAAATIANYVLVYLGTWASTTLGIVQRSAFASVMLVGLGGVLCDPLSGWLSDRFGRRPVMIVPAVGLALVVLPAFWWVAHYRSSELLYAVSTVLACLLDLSTGTMLVAVAEALPRARRAGGFALIYAVAISAFGGSTQFAVAGLIRLSGDPLMPAYYMLVALVIGLNAMWHFPETRPA